MLFKVKLLFSSQSRSLSPARWRGRMDPASSHWPLDHGHSLKILRAWRKMPPTCPKRPSVVDSEFLASSCATTKKWRLQQAEVSEAPFTLLQPQLLCLHFPNVCPKSFSKCTSLKALWIEASSRSVLTYLGVGRSDAQRES